MTVAGESEELDDLTGEAIAKLFILRLSLEAEFLLHSVHFSEIGDDEALLDQLALGLHEAF